ncbi:putative transcriptional regulatory protein, GntR family (fragment) [Bradyrhizobium sp. ORS 375]
MTTTASRPKLKTRFKPARLKPSAAQPTRPLARLSLREGFKILP